jgi:hypothetical protein
MGDRKVKLPIGSYTFYSTLNNCPHQAYHRYVGKTTPFISTPEMDWGNQVHTAMEARIKSGATLPDKMAAAEGMCATFHDMSKVVGVRVELQLAMTADGKPCDYKDWDHVWFRGKLDCVTRADATAWMVDWKTGNVREDPFELECGALLLKVNWPELEDIKGEYFWLKTGQPGLRYTLNQHAKTYERLDALNREAKGYLASTTEANGLAWPKRKTPLCGWCDVLSCEHNTKLKRLAKEGK